MSLLLDTNAVILVLRGSELSPVSPGEKVFISVISEIELLGWDGLTSSEEAAVRAFLSTVSVLTLDSAVKDAAIEFRRQRRLKTPDAIIAATARIHGATLITNDKQLLNLPGISVRTLKN